MTIMMLTVMCLLLVAGYPMLMPLPVVSLAGS